jgi:2-haloacid dehalogenase
MGGLDFDHFQVLTFDCYGTLIDWERGILNALRPVLERHETSPPDDAILQAFAVHETALEAGRYLGYREVLAQSLRRIAGDLGFATSKEETAQFAASVADWPPFDDSVASLRQLSQRFSLGVITNCDDDLFASSNERLGTRFEWIVTAQGARTYKPSLNNFRVALDKIGLPKDRILHVAQSLHHDHVPAKQLGLTTVWVNRRHDKVGFGATPVAAATPDLVVPDLKSFAVQAMASPA